MPLLQKAYLGTTQLWRDPRWYEGSAGFFNNVSAATTVTASASANTKGAWTEVISSTSANSSLLIFNITAVGAATQNTAALLDIATGASGSETAISSNIAIGAAGGIGQLVFGFPVKIPSGTRISARIQSVTGSRTATVQIFAVTSGDYDTTPTSVDVIGGNTANSQGISFSGASGTWTEAIASTSRAYRAVALVLSAHNTTILDHLNTLYDVGVGAAGSEIAFGSVRHNYTAAETSYSSPPFTYLFGRNIPAGSRLAVRHPLTANPERYGFCLIGIP